MLTFWGGARKYCDGMDRRNFLRIGAFGAGLTLADVLRARACANPATPVRAKSAIMIYLPGGPSHIDTYDLKPNAPVEFRGEFKPIASSVAGIELCEHFPLQARMMEKLAIVRSLVSVDEHSDSLVMTGYSEQQNRTIGHPSFGSVVSKFRSATPSDLPHFVSLRGLTRGQEPGFLGVSHRAFTTSGPGMRNLRLQKEVSEGRLEDRKSLLSAFDVARRDADASGTMEGLDAFAAKAFDMVTTGKVRTALDLNKEDGKTRERYKGLDQFLTARRLVEAGVGCVTLAYGGWDTHGQNFQTLRKQLPVLDRGIANLIQDLHDRGMGDDVVTIVWGEFGRTPKVNGTAGRDHWAPAMSALIAGGGLKMGQVVGATSARAEYPKDRRYTASQVLSTIYQVLGIDPAMTFTDASGRPVHLLDDREPVKELI